MKGFTLIELIVVLSIFLIIGGTVLSVISISLRGTRKTDVMLQVKQNGDFALNEMIRNIRYAASLDSPVICYPPQSTTSITITSQSDGGSTQYSCPADPNSPISSNSAALTDPTITTVKACTFTCSQPQNGGTPEIKIQYTLSSKTQSGLFESQSTLPFQSSVTLRNVIR